MQIIIRCVGTQYPEMFVRLPFRSSECWENAALQNTCKPSCVSDSNLQRDRRISCKVRHLVEQDLVLLLLRSSASTERKLPMWYRIQQYTSTPQNSGQPVHVHLWDCSGSNVTSENAEALSAVRILWFGWISRWLRALKMFPGRFETRVAFSGRGWSYFGAQSKQAT